MIQYSTRSHIIRFDTVYICICFIHNSVSTEYACAGQKDIACLT